MIGSTHFSLLLGKLCTKAIFLHKVQNCSFDSFQSLLFLSYPREVGSACPGDSWHSFLCAMTCYSFLCSTEPTYPCQRTLGTHFCAQWTTDDRKSSKNRIFIISKLSQAFHLLASNIHLIFFIILDILLTSFISACF